MIVAQKWYCIAQTTSIGSSSGIKVEFGNYYRLLLNASVDWGNAVISIQFSNISKDIVASVRLRNNGQYFYLDIKLSEPFDTDFSTSLYDNSSWNLASSVSDLSGVPICIIDDINSLNTSQTGGESYLVEDENGDLHPIPKKDGTARGIYTDSFISSGGKNPNTEGGGGGGFTEFIIKFDDVEVNPEGYMSVDGIVTLPNYPSLDGYLLKDTADNLYQAKGDYATREELNALDNYIKSLFTAEYNENNVLISIKANAGLWTNQYLSSGGKNANAGGEGGGVTSFDIMFEGDNVSRYPLEDGVVTLPAYPTMPDVSGFILKTTADLLYQPKGNYLTSIPSEYITETELSNALSPYLLSQTAADTYATIDALNTLKTNTDERLQSLENMFEWDEDGHIHAKAGLYTDSFLSSGGKNTTEGTTGGGLTEFSVIFNGTQYDSSNGVATIDGTYATTDNVNNAIITSKSYTDTSIANLINGAPSTLDTLKEIADAMDANQDVVDALEEAIGTKASQTELDTLSGRVTTAESGISTNKTAINTLQGYFTNGIAKEAAKVSKTFKITFNGTTYEYNGSAAKEINFSAANIVSALGTTPVNRAKGDESGNNIKTTYATKTALQEFIDKIEKYFTFGEDNIKANYGLWTDSYLSSGGQNSSGGGTGGIDIQAMWDALAASSNEQIHINHIPDLSGRYLSTSGGTIKGTTDTPLNIKSTSSVYIGFYRDSDVVGYYGFNGAGTPRVYVGSSGYNVIHSGNIGSQRVSYATSADKSRRADYIQTLSTNGEIWYGDQYMLYGQWASTTVLELKVDGYKTLVWKAKELATARTIWGQSFDGTQNLYGAIFMGATEDTLYNVMQVTSNLNLTIGLDTAKAGKTTLISGNKITFRYGTTPTVGMQINSSGNVTIGASDLASTTTKLYIDGGIRFAPRTIWGNSFDGTGNIENQNLTVYKNPTTNVNSWTRGIVARNSSNNIIGRIGFYGMGNTLSYAYIGSDYLNPWLKIDSDGNVGIGATNPSYALDIYRENQGDLLQLMSNVSYACAIYKPSSGASWSVGANNENKFYWYNSSVAARVATIDVNGNFTAKGNISASGNITTTSGRFYDSSDIRLKNIISDLSNLSLDTILSIPRVRYQWKKDNSMTMIGTIAQPLIGKFDELLHKDSEGMYSVDYDSISVIALEGVAKVKREVDILREKINELEEKVKMLGGTI